MNGTERARLTNRLKALVEEGIDLSAQLNVLEHSDNGGSGAHNWYLMYKINNYFNQIDSELKDYIPTPDKE